MLTLEVKCPSLALPMLSLFEFVSSNGMISRLSVACPGMAKWFDTEEG